MYGFAHMGNRVTVAFVICLRKSALLIASGVGQPEWRQKEMYKARGFNVHQIQ